MVSKIKKGHGYVLVTGGAGFIGSALCESLLLKGYNVICLDNLITGKKSNIMQLTKNSNFEFLEMDVSKSKGLKINGPVDFLFHLASPASPVDYQKYPIETMMANSLGTLNALNLAKEKKARFLLASTSEVYGDPEKHPQKEGYWGHVNPVGPRSCYDESKRFAEALVMVHQKELDVRIARIFNTYGPKMRKNDGRAVPNFIEQALKGSPITVYGNGKQTRSFCFISDMVDALERLMFIEGLESEIFNLGNPEEYTILEIAQKIKDLIGSKSKIIFQPLPIDDPVRRKPDISKAVDKLKWKPHIGLDEGLRRTIEGH